MSKGRFILTGKHVLIGTSCGFALIISVNLVLAYFAVTTFPGLETTNSYLTSKQFNTIEKKQRELGWKTNIHYADEKITLVILDKNNNFIFPKNLNIRLGKATTDREDTSLIPIKSQDSFIINHKLIPGNWLVFIEAVNHEQTIYKQRINLIVDS
jgi:nitrogen fixation protein FixH